jgi:peptide/nickel transport system substrate-binding protein
VRGPPSCPFRSIYEEATVFAEGPMMGVFNNLVIFDPHVPQNSLQSIVPDLATAWSWSEEGTELTLPLGEGVTWHDGQPFTARDVVCTFSLLTGKSSDKLRVNPRKSWYRNLERVITNSGYEVTFHLTRPQPAFLTGAGSGPDPDQNLHLLYGCGAELNYNGYCNPEVVKLIDQQSSEADQEKRKQLVWEIERNR